MSHGLVDDAFKRRVTESHTREIRARVYRWESGAVVPIGLTQPNGDVIYDLPVIDGDLIMDSTDPHQRRLNLTVAGEEWIPEDGDSPLAPFGQYIVLEVRIEFADATWSPWLKLGEFPIISHKVDRPDGTSEVIAADWSYRVNEYQYVGTYSWKDRSRVEAIENAVKAALADNSFAIHSSANAKLVIGEEAGQVSSGTGRWDFVQNICDAANLEAFFDREGDLVIRDAVIDYDGYVPGAGPDIGNVVNPVAELETGSGGSIVTLKAEITRENGCNGVIINVIPTASPPKSGSYDKAQYKSRTVLEKWKYGPAAWGNQFGRITVQRDKRVKRVTTRALNDAALWGQSILTRRRGVLRRLEMEALPMWWLDPDDKVRVTWAQRMPDGTERVRDEAHYVERIEFPLAPGGGPMRLFTRQVTVVELSEPWVLEPDVVNPPPPPPVLPPPVDLLAGYQAELADYPSTYPTHREYMRITSVTDGDTFRGDVYSDANCTIPAQITHPISGNKYSNMRIRITGIQCPEVGWMHGSSATASLQSVLQPGDIVRLRSDTNTAADAAGNERVWRDAYKKMGDGSWYNLALHQIDAGWAYAFPLKFEPRNSMNRIIHTKIAMYHGLGMFSGANTLYGEFALHVFPNPEGPDTPEGEYIKIKNLKNQSRDISRCRIGDPSPLSSYVFPAGTVIGPYEEIQVFVGQGTNGGGKYYMGLTSILLNNDYEIAVMHGPGNDPAGSDTGAVCAMTQCINSQNTVIPIEPDKYPVPQGVPVGVRSANSPDPFPGLGG